MFSAITKTTEKFIIDNSPAILTGVGVVGSISTAVLAAKGGISSGRKIEDIETERYHDKDASLGPLTTKEKLSWTWKNYLPAVGVGTLTITSIIMAQRINMKRAAALAAAYAISENKFKEYKGKVAETLGLKKEEALQAEIAQKDVNDKPPVSSQIIMAGGDVLFKDGQSGRYFRSTMEKVKQAQNDTNYEILHNNHCSLTDFYDRIGLSATSYSEEVGWNSDHLMELTFSAVITADTQEPCLVMDYHVSPTRGYSRLQ